MTVDKADAYIRPPIHHHISENRAW